MASWREKAVPVSESTPGSGASWRQRAVPVESDSAQETFPEVPVYEDDSPTSTAPRARSMGEELFGLAEQFAAGANRGVVKLAELPYDAINNFPRLANLIPGVEANKLSDTRGFNQVFTREDPLQEAAQCGAEGLNKSMSP